jgi:hypothetical protein
MREPARGWDERESVTGKLTNLHALAGKADEQVMQTCATPRPVPPT